jgi:hypothetical protein
MAADDIFSSSMKYAGIFNFRDFYEFCYKWLTDQKSMKLKENIYEEKLSGNEKEIKIEWETIAKVSDYFHLKMKIEFTIRRLVDVELTKGDEKIKTNKGEVKIKLKGTILKDPNGQFETSPQMKIWRGIYEKFIINSRVKQYEDKLIGDCDEFLAQTKAFLDLEGRK